jgi:hypothetical protein
LPTTARKRGIPKWAKQLDLCKACLLDRDEFSLELRQLGGSLTVASDEEGRRPENHQPGD